MIQENCKKFLELSGIGEGQRYREARTGPELVKSGRYYLDLLQEIEARGQVERVRDLISLILAQALQPAARQAYGNGGSAAISRVLEAEWNKGGEEFWERQLLLLKDKFSSMGLKPEMERNLIDCFAEFPRQIREMLATAAARLSLVPVENVGEMAGVLAEMYREENHAKQDRDH